MDKYMLKVPVELLEKLLESCSNEAKSEFLNHVRKYKSEIDKKGHEAEGFYIDDNGKIKFNDALYMEAVYRGKIDTYGEIYKKELETLASSKKMFKSMVDEQEKLEFQLSSKLYQQRISPRVNTFSEREIKALSKKK